MLGMTARIDPERRRILVDFGDGPHLEIGPDGFPAGSSPSPEAASRRAAARTRSYAALRSALRASRADFPKEAIRQAGIAVAEADRADDRPLGAWARRVRIRVHIDAGATARDIAPLLEEIRTDFGSPGDAWYEAGRGFHLRGRIDDALRWYREGMKVRAEQNRGRLIWEYVEAIVFALGEAGRWDEAREAMDTYRRSDRTVFSFYRQWIDWRAAGGFASPFTTRELEVDAARYLALESDAQFVKNLDLLAGRLERQRPTLSDPYPSLVTSLLADTHARQGDIATALAEARNAYDQIRVQLDDDTVARAHFDLVVARYARIARQAGKNDEAAAAEKALREFRAGDR